MLFKVLGLVEVEERRYISNGKYEDCMVMRPVVRYHPRITRHSHALTYEENERRRNKQGIRLVLKNSKYMRVPMSPQYAKDVLEDREWKKAHPALVPIMVNYEHVIQAMKAPVNGAIVKWDNYEE